MFLTEKDVKVLDKVILTSETPVCWSKYTTIVVYAFYRLLNSYVELLCRFASNPLGVNELMLMFGLLVTPSPSGTFMMELDFGGVGLMSDAIEKSDEETSRFRVTPDV